MAGKRNGGSDAAVVLLALAALAVVVSMGAVVLYLPLRKYSSRNPGRGLGVLGIAIIAVGLGILIYQSSSNRAEVSETPSAVSSSPSDISWAGWLPLAGGLAVYTLGLVVGSGYHTRLLAANGEIENLVNCEGLTEDQMRQAALRICESRSLPVSEVQSAIANSSRVLILRSVENSPTLPTAPPPEGVFLKPGEQCHVAFSSVSFHEDVFGTRRTTAGGAVYWRVADGVTLRPSAYSSQSMPTSELRQVDSGCLLITNSRVIFQGRRYRKDTPLSKIEGLSQYDNGFQIQTSGKSKREVFSMSPTEVRLAMALISRLVVP